MYMKKKPTPKEKALRDIIKQLKKAKTLVSLKPKEGEWFSILAIVDGHLSRHTVIVDGKRHVMTPKFAGDYLEMGACLDPIWLSKEEVKENIDLQKSRLAKLIETTPKEQARIDRFKSRSAQTSERMHQQQKKDVYQKELINLLTFEKRYLP